MTDASEVFEKQQETYRKVVDNNYLHHHDIIRKIQEYIAANITKHNISVLDLGCGDASMSARCFQQTSSEPTDPVPKLPAVRRFVGVDLAEKPLHCASQCQSLFNERTSMSLRKADFFEYLDSEDEAFDVILAMFAVHHLKTEGKVDLMKRVARHLRPSGIFIMADVVNVVPDRSRDELMKDWETFMFKVGLPKLSLEEKHQMWEHVSTYDLPDDFPTITRLFHESGFKDFECLFKDDIFVALWIARV